MDPRPEDDVLQLAFRFRRLAGLSDSQQAAATGDICVRDSAPQRVRLSVRRRLAPPTWTIRLRRRVRFGLASRVDVQ